MIIILFIYSFVIYDYVSSNKIGSPVLKLFLTQIRGFSSIKINSPLIQNTSVIVYFLLLRVKNNTLYCEFFSQYSVLFSTLKSIKLIIY